MEDQVVHAVVAVHDARLLARRDVLRQPGDEVVHRLDLLGLGGPVLLGPAPDLTREIVARLAVVGQADGGVVHLVKRRDDAVHLVVDRRALGGRHARQRLVPEHAPLDVLHDVEGAADDALVLAQREHPRHRDAGAVQRLHDAVFALDCVRRGQQLRRGCGLGAHDVVLAARGEAERGIGLPALELLDGERAGEPLDVAAQEGFQGGGVETMPLLHRHGADELLAHLAAWRRDRLRAGILTRFAGREPGRG